MGPFPLWGFADIFESALPKKQSDLLPAEGEEKPETLYAYKKVRGRWVTGGLDELGEDHRGSRMLLREGQVCWNDSGESLVQGYCAARFVFRVISVARLSGHRVQGFTVPHVPGKCKTG